MLLKNYLRNIFRNNLNSLKKTTSQKGLVKKFFHVIDSMKNLLLLTKYNKNMLLECFNSLYRYNFEVLVAYSHLEKSDLYFTLNKILEFTSNKTCNRYFYSPG